MTKNQHISNCDRHCWTVLNTA